MATIKDRMSNLLKRRGKSREDSHRDNLSHDSSPSHLIVTTRRDGRLQPEDAHQNLQNEGRIPIKSTSNHNNRKVPELPDEVVRQIMLSATDTLSSPYSSHCRGPITSGLSTPFLLRANYDEEIEAELQKKNQRTKISLSMVSKLWRELSADVLFNTILLRNYEQLSLLSRTFDENKSKRGGTEGPGCWAWLVRRLWVARPFRFEYRTIQVDETTPSTVFEFIRRCPKIVTFRNFGQFPNQQNVYTHTQPACRQIFHMIMRPNYVEEKEYSDISSLDLSPARLDVDLNVSMVPVAFIEHGSCFPFIQVLKLQSLTPCDGWPEETMRTDVEFPVLEYLHIDNTRWFIQATLFRMPALRRLSFSPTIVSPYLPAQERANRIQIVTLFLERHGACLEELSLISRLQWDLDLNRLCPNLLSLNVVALDYVGRTAELFLAQTSHRKVIQVGFSGLLLDEYVEWEDSDAFFSPLFLSFPSLRTARDLTWNSRIIEEGVQSWSSQPSVLKPRREIWLTALELMREKHIQFLDCRGVPFRIPNASNKGSASPVLDSGIGSEPR